MKSKTYLNLIDILLEAEIALRIEGWRLKYDSSKKYSRYKRYRAKNLGLLAARVHAIRGERDLCN